MKMPKTSVKTSYENVEKNIYKTNGRYRVRVGAFSGYEKTIKEARKMRTRFTKAHFSDPIIG